MVNPIIPINMNLVDFSKSISDIGSKNTKDPNVKKFYKMNGKIYALTKLNKDIIEKQFSNVHFKLAKLEDIVNGFNQALLDNEERKPKHIKQLKANGIYIFVNQNNSW